MATLESIIKYCQETQPALIYLAVGCSQRYYSREKASPQQYPPFVERWPFLGKKVCILMDPILEKPPYCYRDLGIPDSETETDIATSSDGNVTVFCIRRNFNTHRLIQESEPDVRALHALCDVASAKTKFIYQDYSGALTDELYPKPAHRYEKNVLFDVTYADGGCFIDFTKVRLIMDNGDFIQPKTAPLTSFRQYPEVITKQMAARKSDLGYYIHRYYHVLLGNKEPRDWCTEPIIRSRMAPLCKMYGLGPIPEKKTLYTLMQIALFDFCNVTGCYMTDTEVAELIEKPDGYLDTLTMLHTISQEN